MVVTKSVACVVRATPRGSEVLVFEHPDGTIQIPKGTVEEDESPACAVLRELREESGIAEVTLLPEVSRLERRLPSGPSGDGPLEDQVWHVFWLEPRSELPASWEHVVTDGPLDAGLTFSFHWVLLARASDLLHPLFDPVVRALLETDPRDGR